MFVSDQFKIRLICTDHSERRRQLFFLFFLIDTGSKVANVEVSGSESRTKLKNIPRMNQVDILNYCVNLLYIMCKQLFDSDVCPR